MWGKLAFIRMALPPRPKLTLTLSPQRGERDESVVCRHRHDSPSPNGTWRFKAGGRRGCFHRRRDLALRRVDRAILWGRGGGCRITRSWATGGGGGPGWHLIRCNGRLRDRAIGIGNAPHRVAASSAHQSAPVPSIPTPTGRRAYPRPSGSPSPHPEPCHWACRSGRARRPPCSR